MKKDKTKVWWGAVGPDFGHCQHVVSSSLYGFYDAIAEKQKTNAKLIVYGPTPTHVWFLRKQIPPDRVAEFDGWLHRNQGVFTF
jgi:hypothetical protein